MNMQNALDLARLIPLPLPRVGRLPTDPEKRLPRPAFVNIGQVGAFPGRG